MNTTDALPAFAIASADGISAVATEWYAEHHQELMTIYRARCKERNEEPSTLNFVGWCFKRYERYVEACAARHYALNKPTEL